MGWSLGYDTTWRRDIGYGVPAYCDHPKCDEEIDRGLSYVCGDEPYGGDHGCGLYFCEEHRPGWRGNYRVCTRCSSYKRPYKHPKPDHPNWIIWKATDDAWAEWRKDNPSKVPYVLYVTQGQGGGPESFFWNLDAAVTYVRAHKGEGSFGIKYPNGEWHKW